MDTLILKAALLHEAADLPTAADYAAKLRNHPGCARLCLVQGAAGTWAVCRVLETLPDGGGGRHQPAARLPESLPDDGKTLDYVAYSVFNGAKKGGNREHLTWRVLAISLLSGLHPLNFANLGR